MEKSAIISVRSFSDLNKDEVIEVVTPGKFHLEKVNLRLCMKSRKYQAWMEQLLL